MIQMKLANNSLRNRFDISEWVSEGYLYIYCLSHSLRRAAVALIHDVRFGVCFSKFLHVFGEIRKMFTSAEAHQVEYPTRFLITA